MTEELFDDALVWDQHGCLPLHRHGTVDGLRDYHVAGCTFVSVNVGFDAIPWDQSLEVLMRFRGQILDRPDWLTLVDDVDGIQAARAGGKLAVAFDLEGADALDGRVSMVETYYRLGVRTMLIAYNLANAAGGGCHGDPDDGLTGFGREVVAEMNRVGMVVDATHCSRRTTLDLFEASSAPVVFSHSVPSAVKDHPRNIDDEQIRGCAETGGVVGINGVGIFLGDNVTATEDLFRAVDHTVDVVGPEHVGLGLDYVVDRTELSQLVGDNAAMFPRGSGYPDLPVAFVHPRQLRELSDLMTSHGYPDSAVRGILGDNFMRVANKVWK